jgi:hypothetical protein
MNHFINIVWQGKEEVDAIVAETVVSAGSTVLTESTSATYEVFETETETVLCVETNTAVTDDEADTLAESIANQLFDLGYDSFDIEISQ